LKAIGWSSDLDEGNMEAHRRLQNKLEEMPKRIGGA
jgi:hypothetical protein